MRRRVADRCEGAVTMPVERHVAVDLVRDDHDAAAVADRGQPAQRLLRPDDARGIVRVGEEQQPAVVVQKGFELLEVHFVAVARAPQRVADHAASHLFGDQPEGVVDGRLDDHLVARTGKCQHCHADTLDDAGNEAHPRRIGTPAVAGFDPRGDLRPVVVGQLRIAQHGMVEPPPECVEDEIGRCEVHVRHPQGQQLLAAEHVSQRVVFYGVRAVPVDDPVEIIGFHRCRATGVYRLFLK